MSYMGAPPCVEGGRMIVYRSCLVLKIMEFFMSFRNLSVWLLTAFAFTITSQAALAAREGGGAWDFESKINSHSAAMLILEATVAFTSQNGCDAKSLAGVAKIALNASTDASAIELARSAAQAELSQEQQNCLGEAVALIRK